MSLLLSWERHVFHLQGNKRLAEQVESAACVGRGRNPVSSMSMSTK